MPPKLHWQKRFDHAQVDEWMNFRVAEQKRWQEEYAQMCQNWCKISRDILNDHKDRPWEEDKCAGCGRTGDTPCILKYGARHEIWYVLVGYGSVIADNDMFVVAKHDQMEIQHGAAFCDTCLVDYVEAGTWRVVRLDVGPFTVDGDARDKIRESEDERE